MDVRCLWCGIDLRPDSPAPEHTIERGHDPDAPFTIHESGAYLFGMEDIR